MQMNVAADPDLMEETPEMAIEESFLAATADLVYALQQKLAEPYTAVKSLHSLPLQLRNVSPFAAVAEVVYPGTEYSKASGYL